MSFLQVSLSRLLAVLLDQEILESCISVFATESCVPEFNKLAFCSSVNANLVTRVCLHKISGLSLQA